MFRPLFSVAALGTALGATFLLTGCGGGGGGPSSPNEPPIDPPSEPQLLFSDDFSGSALDQSRWQVLSNSSELQRTRFGLTPQIQTEGGTSFARVQLQTYNPSVPGQRFYGTEFFTRQRFARGEGIEVQARARGTNINPGVIWAFFMIYDRFEGGSPSAQTYRKTEIDFEFLGAEQEQFSPEGQRRRLYLNIWDDWNEPRDGFDGDDVESPNRLHDDKTYQVASQSGFDWADWHVYGIRWLPNRTEFLLDGVVQRTETQIRPDEAMSVRFNIWSGIPEFDQAYSPNFQPASSSSQNRNFYFDVDYVRVNGLGSNTNAVSKTADSNSSEGISPDFRR